MQKFEYASNTNYKQQQWSDYNPCSPSLLLSRALGRAIAALAVFPILFLLCATPAQAATWPVNGSWLAPSVEFGETYTAGDLTCGHRGIDIPVPAGTQVSATLAGTVSFVGSIPSGDSLVSADAKVKTMRGVSVTTDSGETLTYMPLAQTCVKRGQRVEEGEALGTLAACGDRSSSAPHLHMGYKVGSTYKDPMALFSAVGQEAAQETVQETTPEGVAASAAAASPAGESAQAGADYSQEAGQQAGSAQESVSASSAANEQASVSAQSFEPTPGSVESGEVAWQVAEPAGFDLLAAVHAHAAQLYALVAALAAGGVAFMFVRWGRRAPRKIAHFINLFLKRLKGGGIVYGLFPASGLTFISRGRIARRR